MRDVKELTVDIKAYQMAMEFFAVSEYYAHNISSGFALLRQGKYKLIKWYEDDSVELYDLSKDISEKKNIAKTEPAVAARMKSDLEAWLKANNAVMPERIT